MKLLQKMLLLSCAGLAVAQVQATLGGFASDVAGVATGAVKKVTEGAADVVEPVPVVRDVAEGVEDVVDTTMNATQKVVDKTVAEPLGKEKKEVKYVETEPEDVIIEEESIEEGDQE